MLPGEALLEIFDWYLIGLTWHVDIEAWQMLVHVCQKWRNLVFESPHRLNLRLLCTDDSPVGKILDIWPALPIVIRSRKTRMGEGNIVAALTHNVRVCGISIYCVNGSLWEKDLVAMQESFPALTHLHICPNYEAPPIVSDSFLGGSAPNLRYLTLGLVPFPGLPKLLSSATHLVKLDLWGIPQSGYFSPEAMATALSALTSLETIALEFKSPRSCPGRGLRHPPPTTTRSVLPALTKFTFKGVSEYLEDLVARINAPILRQLKIEFFAQLIFHTPLLAQFIDRTPNFMAPDEAHVIFSPYNPNLILPQTYGDLHLEIPFLEPDWQLSMLAQVCSSSLYLISSLEHLYIHESERYRDIGLKWGVDIENIQWLELLRPFTTVKALYLSQHFTTQIVPALEELVGERATEVLPALQSLFLEDLHLSGPVQEAVETFVAARRLSGLPLTVSHWDWDRANSRW